MSDMSEDFPSSRVKLLCSYAGKILPRPGDGRLRYVGGEKRIITVNRDISFPDLMMKMLEVHSQTVSIKYQLPNEDLDALVSVCSDEDLENMMDEHDSRDGFSRIRVFLFSSTDYDLDHLSDSSGDHRSSEQLYLDAINGVLDSSSTKNSGSAVSDGENLLGGIDLDPWSSIEDTFPAQMPGQTLQSSVPPPPLSPPFSLIDVLHTDSFAKSGTPPCKPPVIPIIPTTRLQESGNGNTYPGSLSLEASISHVDLASSIDLPATIPQLVDSTSEVILAPLNPGAEAVSKIQNNMVSTLPFPANNIVASEVLPVNSGSTQNNISGLQLFSELPMIQAEIQRLGNEQHQVKASMPRSSWFTAERQENIPHQDHQADDFESYVCEPSTGPTSTSEKALENWSTSIAKSNLTLQSAISTLPVQDPQVTSPDLVIFSPKCEASETRQRSKESNDSDSKSAPFCIFSPTLETEKEAIRKESQTQHVDFLLDSDLLAPCSDSESLQQVDGQEPDRKHPVGSCKLKEGVVVASKVEIGSVEKNAQQDNLIDLDIQQGKQEVVGVQSTIPNIVEMPFVRLEQPNYLDAEFRQLREVHLSFSDGDIPPSGSPSTTGLGFDAKSQQSIEHTLPENSYAHAYGLQKPPQTMDVIDASKKSPSTSSNDLSLLEKFDGFDLHHLEASKSDVKQSIKDNRGYAAVQFDEFQRAKLDKLGDLFGDSPASGLGATELHSCQQQSSGLACITPNEAVEKPPCLPPMDLFLDLLTPPTPPSLTTSVGISSPPTLSSKSAAQNLSHLLVDPNNIDILKTPSIPPDNILRKADVARTSVKEPKQATKHATSMDQEGSFSFSAGQRLEIEEEEKVAEANHYVERELDKLDPVDYDEYKSVHASLLEEAHLNNSPITACAAEIEAIARGLQIIRNSDLEERRELGSGTFGTVYHGKWRGSDVAIKRIKASCFAGSPSEQERLKADFWREACILAQLHHPNVVAFYGVVPDGPGGTLATVTEYMVNGSLKQVLRKNDRALDRRKRLLIAMDTTFGMEYLHSKNIVHFDLKCDNLLVNMRDPQRPICKVGDLGLSKVKQQTLVSGGVRGTLPWMAPELLNGNSSKVCEKVDVFSFGIVMWELLTGEEPYADLHYGAIIGGIVNNTLRPTVPKGCDSTWRSLMERCWSADPNERPSFTEIAYELRAMSTQLPKLQAQNQV